jgi:hypothetical protein
LRTNADSAETELGRKIVDGQSLIGIRYTYTARDVAGIYEFWFDPTRGYLPVRINRALVGKEQDGTQIRILAARDCGKGRWFPERIVSATPKPDGSGVRLNEMLVLELDTDHRPSPEEFAIALPGGTTVKRRDGQLGGIKLQEDEVIRASDLPDLFERVRLSSEAPTTGAGLMGRLRTPWRTWTVIGLGVLLLLGLVWLKRRGRATPSRGPSVLVETDPHFTN